MVESGNVPERTGIQHQCSYKVCCRGQHNPQGFIPGWTLAQEAKRTRTNHITRLRTNGREGKWSSKLTNKECLLEGNRCRSVFGSTLWVLSTEAKILRQHAPMHTNYKAQTKWTHTHTRLAPHSASIADVTAQCTDKHYASHAVDFARKFSNINSNLLSCSKVSSLSMLKLNLPRREMEHRLEKRRPIIPDRGNVGKSQKGPLSLHSGFFPAIELSFNHRKEAAMERQRKTSREQERQRLPSGQDRGEVLRQLALSAKMQQCQPKGSNCPAVSCSRCNVPRGAGGISSVVERGISLRMAACSTT